MKPPFLLLGILVSGTVCAQNSPRFTLTRSVVAGGGATLSASSRFQLSSTIAQPSVSIPSSGRFSIQGGFWHRPALEIVAAARVGTNFVFSFETEPGKAYSVEFVDSLSSPNWQTFVSFPGDGAAKTVTQSAIGVTNRYYRIIQH